jgi:hypothetical protein
MWRWWNSVFDFDFDFDFKIIIWRAPRPFGASPTQPYKCGQYFKIKVKVEINVFI